MLTDRCGRAIRMPDSRDHGHCAGFTLIELMMAVAVAALLAVIALPAFEHQLLTARRADALAAAMQLQSAEERFRSNAGRYGSLTDIGLPDVSPAGHYRLSLDAVDADRFDWMAIATGPQARDRRCRHLKLSVIGLNLARSSGPDSAVANDAGENRRCWNL